MNYPQSEVCHLNEQRNAFRRPLILLAAGLEKEGLPRIKITFIVVGMSV